MEHSVLGKVPSTPRSWLYQLFHKPKVFGLVHYVRRTPGEGIVRYRSIHGVEPIVVNESRRFARSFAGEKLLLFGSTHFQGTY